MNACNRNVDKIFTYSKLVSVDERRYGVKRKCFEIIK